MLKHQNKLKTHAGLIKTSVFSEGCHKDAGRHPEQAAQPPVADPVLPDRGDGLQRLGDRELGQAMFEHPSVQIL